MIEQIRTCSTYLDLNISIFIVMIYLIKCNYTEDGGLSIRNILYITLFIYSLLSYSYSLSLYYAMIYDTTDIEMIIFIMLFIMSLFYTFHPHGLIVIIQQK